MTERSALLLLVGLVAAGCLEYPLDVLGVEERVINTEQQQRSDDTLSEKHPQYDPELTITETFGYCEFVLNKSASVTRLSIGKLQGEDRALEGRLFPTRAAALESLGQRPVIPSMEVINGALKPFNDGLYAAVELLAEDGAGGALVNKRSVFDALLAALLARHQAESDRPEFAAAAVDFAAAAEVGGSSAAAIPADLETDVNDRLAGFQEDPFTSQPVGFYTWTPELEAVFRRDRLLMYSAPEPGPVAAVAEILAQDSGLREQYGAVLGLYAGLTNPLSAYSPLDVQQAAPTGASEGQAMMEAFLQAHPDYAQPCGKIFSWLPPSTSPETELFGRVACLGSLDGNLLDALIAAIQAGTVDLTPTEDSGWYDRQVYALETVLLPERATERDHLLLTREYKDKLVETFKSLIIQTRETHVKQLESVAMPASGEAPSVDLYPLLPVEPFPTFYLRTARAYAFLLNLLRTALGEPALEQTARLLEDGTRADEPLATELADKIQLLYGLHLVAAASIGMHHELSDEEKSNVDIEVADAIARSWLATWQEDADVRRDPRVIVPVVQDFRANTSTHWAVAGVKVVRMHASFPEGHEPEVERGGCNVGEFMPFEPYLLVEQTLQVTRQGRDVMTREEYRALADECATVDELRAALEAAQ